jgi:hypothetical protein
MRAAHLLALTICLVGCEGTVSESPSPSPALLARGNFVTNVGEVVELEATRESSSVTGHMTVLAQGQNGPYAVTVDLQCARKTEDGPVMIGGVTTDSTGQEAPQEGTWAGDRPRARIARGGVHMAAGGRVAGGQLPGVSRRAGQAGAQHASGRGLDRPD